MEIYQLRSFVAVAEAGHLTRAAEKLHVSQPAVSAQIKALEDELELALFERTSSGMVLTPAGERLLADAEKVLAAAQAMRNEAKALKGEVAGRVRVGTMSDPGFIRVGEFLSATVERYPLLQVELHHEITGAAFAKVRDAELDASFYYGDLEHPGVGKLRLRGSTYRVAAPAAWKKRVADADWGEVALQPWIITPSISSHHKLVRALFDKHGIEPTKVVEADQESVIASLVVSGVGLSLIREELALEKQAAGQVCLWRDVRLESTLWFIYLLARKDDPVIRALLGVLHDIWKLAEQPARKDGRRG
ncbi:MAG: LysR family transcriptional regulator [Betaproteobacteria bacterium]|nr:MAG: LysR family transcriptional regulator [Betaproteobacteria bacterium]